MKKKIYTVKDKRSQSRRAGSDEPGYRASRLAETRRARRRHRFTLILVAGVVLSVMLFSAVFLLMRSRGGDGNESISGGGGEITSVLVMVDSSSGELEQVLLLSIQDETTFRAVSMSARTVAQVPDRGFLELREVAALEDQALMDQVVADLLQHPVQYHVELDIETMLLAAEQVGTIDISLRQAATLTVGDGPVALVAGANPVESKPAIALLGAAAQDGAAGPAVQAAIIQGLRDAFLARSEADRQSFSTQLHKRVKTDLDEGQLVSLFLDITSSDTKFTVSLLPATLAGDGEDWYLEPVAGEVETLLGQAQESPYKLEIRNGTEVPGVVEAAAEKLSPLGIPVSLQPEASGVNFEFTQIRYGSNAAREGNSIRDLLGAGTLIKDDYLEKDHIVVIIGLDIAASARLPQQ